MSAPDFFAIVVTFNGEEWIERCIGSLLSSAVPIRVVVVDNNSTDRTLALLKSFPSVDVIGTGQNLGFGKANNIGIKKALAAGAGGLLLLNQDAWIERDTLSKLTQIAAANPAYGVLSPIHLNGQGTAVDYKFSYYLVPERCPNLLSDSLLKKDRMLPVYETTFVNAACWFVTKEAIDSIGGFDPLFPHYGEDTDWSHRLQYHGMKLGIAPAALAYHDRPQTGWNLYGLAPGKRFTWRYVEHLIVLKNIRHSLATSILVSIMELGIGIGKSIHRLSVPSIFGEIGAFGKAQLQLFTISRHRKQCKQKSRAFLSA